jgi:hypothetical protein
MAREGGMPFKRQTAFFYQKKNYLYQSKITSRKLALLTAKHGVKSGRKTNTYPNHIHTCP